MKKSFTSSDNGAGKAFQRYTICRNSDEIGDFHQRKIMWWQHFRSSGFHARRNIGCKKSFMYAKAKSTFSLMNRMVLPTKELIDFSMLCQHTRGYGAVICRWKRSAQATYCQKFIKLLKVKYWKEEKSICRIVLRGWVAISKLRLPLLVMQEFCHKAWKITVVSAICKISQISSWLKSMLLKSFNNDDESKPKYKFLRIIIRNCDRNHLQCHSYCDFKAEPCSNSAEWS